MYGRACWRLDAYIRKLMGALGRLIGQHPSHFIITPLLVGLLFGTGLQRLVYQSDPKYLFFPSHSRTASEKARIEKLFPTNYSNYEIGKEMDKEFEAHVIFVPKNDSTILRTEYWNIISDLDELIVKNVTLQADKNITFQDVCVKYKGECVRNAFLSLKQYINEINSGLLELTYPTTQNPTTYEMYQLPIFAGGLTFRDDEHHVVKNIKALRLSYILDPNFSADAHLWLAALLEFLETAHDSQLHVYKMTTRSIAKEFATNVDSAIDFLPLSAALLIAYNTWNALNWKDTSHGFLYLSLVGSFNIVIAIGAAWGVLMYIGVEWISINLASVFILLGVGLDDIYVILSSWRRTSDLLNVPERMSLCYEEAAVSITITSLTNIVSFIMGSAFPVFPSVWIFCLYSGIGIFFIYVWTLTLFGGVLALSGYREEIDRGKKKNESPKTKDSDCGLNHFFSTVLPRILDTVLAKVIVILFYIAYLTVFIYIIITRTKEGLDRSKLSRYDSFLFSYYQAEDLYFRQNPYRFQIVFTEPLDYSNTTIRSQLKDFILKIQESKYISKDEKFEENWLDIFDHVIKKQKEIMIGWTLKNSEHEFIDKLSDTLNHHDIPAIQDNILFNHNKTKIISSRIFIQSDAISNSHEEKLMIKDLYQIIDSSPFKTIIYNPYFLFFDQFLQVLPSTIYSVSITALVVVFITFLLIPNLVFTLWVTFALLSIEIGVLGFMVILDISLDIISMICLIMCVGFSIDYSAHVSYHFVSMDIRKEMSRLQSTLMAYGPPIVQSAISTILGVFGLFFLPSYIIRSFSQLLVIVILLGVLHGTVLLPVLLSLTFCDSGSEECEVIERSPSEVNTNRSIPIIVPPNLYGSQIEKEAPIVSQRSRRRSDSFHRSGKARASVVPQEFMDRSNFDLDNNLRKKDLFLTSPDEEEISSDEEDDILLKSNHDLPDISLRGSIELTDEESEMYI